eukprot:CAMPEP_0177639382 /NCGR_PEP_ID=MMETSP0447-20121125/5990_1 /TAXON_ID=0 /ORGANISM="Stygamoeba regulata, Strain BSH-02190019" /LENGTH=231 /DNA_ID=CAMNT_0019141403 /DNA_START=37 /DNA_END=733 /DNA_ORIENTATION=-
MAPFDSKALPTRARSQQAAQRVRHWQVGAARHLVRFAQLPLLLQRSHGVVDERVQEACDGEHAPDDGAHTCEEVQKCFPRLRLLDADGRQVIVEKYSWHAMHVAVCSNLQGLMVLCDAELVGIDDLLVQPLVLGGHNFDVVLVHGHGLVCDLDGAIQRVHPAREVAAERQFVDDVREVELGDAQELLDVVHVHAVRVEALAGRHVDVAGHLVHQDEARDDAPLVLHVLQKF